VRCVQNGEISPPPKIDPPVENLPGNRTVIVNATVTSSDAEKKQDQKNPPKFDTSKELPPPPIVESGPIPQRTRRPRYDTQVTVVNTADSESPDGREYSEYESFVNDAVEDDFEAANSNPVEEIPSSENALTDPLGANIVEMMKTQESSDTYPATIFEFYDYFKRKKLTSLRTLVRTVFSCPKTLALSFRLDDNEENDVTDINSHDWDGLLRIYEVIDEHPLLEEAVRNSITILCCHHCFSENWKPFPVGYRVVALLKLLLNPYLGNESYFDQGCKNLNSKKNLFTFNHNYM
jgi:hypothetical protein